MQLVICFMLGMILGFVIGATIVASITAHHIRTGRLKMTEKWYEELAKESRHGKKH